MRGGEGGPEVGRQPSSEAAIHISVTADAIRPGDVLSELGGSADGAVILFLGRVRDHNDGRSVTGLDYEVYGEMAERELHDIATEAAARFEVTELRAIHRVAALEIGEISVAISVASPHRDAAYEASRYVIEEIKVRLPIWKRERYADGDTRWVGAPATEEASS